MTDTVIRVENLGKKYVIGRNRERQQYTALRDVIANGAKGLGNRFRHSKDRKQDSASEDFWALKDVSFEIKQGDRLGIIGRNGAGKSTLLKVLSRITEPSEGRIQMKGRVASLLEVGTGFHPELTGRENIYLNGAILGMGKTEISHKFDEIVAFAEVERFLDTPVKRYSSGMYVRLAFAVAAHLEPEILVVDEVLAVGDAQFQKKCLGRMKDISQEGRTVLFVSHNMAAIQSLCSLGLFLESGKTQGIKTINEAISLYESGNRPVRTDRLSKKLKYFDLHSLQFSSLDGGSLKTFLPARIKIVFSGKEQLLYPSIYISIKNKLGQNLAAFELKDMSEIFSIPADKALEVTFDIASLPLMPGEYDLFVELKDMGRDRWEFLPDGVAFEISETPVYGVQSTKPWYGSVGLKVKPHIEIRDQKLLPC